VQTIKQSVWKLFSDNEYKQINNRFKDRFLSLITWLEELELQIPLLTYVALVVRCITFIPENLLQMGKRLLHNILQRLKTVPITAQQAICEALISIPSFRRDIIQHVRQFQYLENMIRLNQIFGRTSTNFFKYLSAKFFSSSDITGTHLTLLVSMQLSELNSYVKFIDDFYASSFVFDRNGKSRRNHSN
jgi:hypothetical protein